MLPARTNTAGRDATELLIPNPKLRLRHEQDLEGFGRVHLPHALARKYPQADAEWCWQYVFPAEKRTADPLREPGSSAARLRRHHVQEENVQRAV